MSEPSWGAKQVPSLWRPLFVGTATARHARMAKEEGVLVAIDSDAHSAHDFANLDYGIGQARRGWLEAADVLNTRPLDALRKLLKRA